jgi:hypothetical protein
VGGKNCENLDFSIKSAYVIVDNQIVRRQIPYSGEQGIKSAEQGIKVPCSPDNCDFSERID